MEEKLRKKRRREGCMRKMGGEDEVGRGGGQGGAVSLVVLLGRAHT